MMEYRLGVLKGDGIGPEIVDASVEILKAAAVQHDLSIEFTELPMGRQAINSLNDPMPQSTKDELENTHGWLLGPHDSAAYPKAHASKRNPSGELRTYFDLYANIRPAKTRPGIESVVEAADLVIYRENTEGFYPDRNMYDGGGEFKITDDVALTTGVFTRKGIERIAHTAFKAADRRREKVTIVHKANVIKLASGLFLDICKEVAEAYPEVEVDDYHVDAMAAHLVRRPEDFDVIVTENMFGDILSDLTGELVGSLGVGPSINTNDCHAMAQAAHGSAPDIAGKDMANPMGMLMSVTMLLEWLSTKHNDGSLLQAGNSIETAVNSALSEGESTKDLGGNLGTQAFTEAIIGRL